MLLNNWVDFQSANKKFMTCRLKQEILRSFFVKEKVKC